MKGCISDIKNPWKRRAVLCMAIVPAVGVHIVMELIERTVSIIKEAGTIFKDIWKGV